MPTTGNQTATRESLLRRWSFGQLGLAEDAEPAAIRRSLLEKLMEDDFVLSDQDRIAVRVLAGVSPGDASHYGPADWEIEARLGEKVESFATQYFTLAVPERQELWALLQAESVGYPAIQMRLRELEPGLAIRSASLNSAQPDVRELGEGILRRFTLPAWELSQARRRDLATFQRKRGRWRNAAKQLQREYSQIAELDTDFLRCFSSLRVQRSAIKGVPSLWTPNRIGLCVIGAGFLFFVALFTAVELEWDPFPRRNSGDNPFIKLNKNYRQRRIADDSHPAKRAVQEGLDRIAAEAAEREKEDARKRLSAEFAKELIRRANKKVEAERQMSLAESTAREMRDVVTARAFYLKAGQLYREVYESDPRDFAALRKSLECSTQAAATMSPDAPERDKVLLPAIASAKLQVASPEVLPEDYRQLSNLLELLSQTRMARKQPQVAWSMLRESVAAMASARTPGGDPALQESLEARLLEVEALASERPTEASIEIAKERRKVWAGNSVRLQRLAYEFTRKSELSRKTAATELARRKDSEAWLTQALAALQDAVAAGPANLDVVDQSAEWAPLRNSPAYQAWRRSIPPGKATEKKP